MRRDLIFDIGLHRGEDSEFYLKKGFSVVAVEANPDLAAEVAESLRSYVASGQLTIINKGIALEEGAISFYVNDAVSVWGTTNQEWALRNEHLGTATRRITIEGLRFSSLLRDYGVPYYLKIDIEGADILCLEDLSVDDCPKFVSIESTKTSFGNLLEEFYFFQKFGYDKYKIVPQHKITRQKLPVCALEGKFVPHKFKEGSSGAFGLELSGEWIELEEALKQYMRIFRKYRLTGDSGSFSNFSLVRNALNAERTQKSSRARIIAGKALRALGRRLNLQAGWYDTHAMRPS